MSDSLVQKIYKIISITLGAGLAAFLTMFLGRYPLFLLRVSPEVAIVLAISLELTIILGAIYLIYRWINGSRLAKIISSIVATFLILISVFFASLWGLFFGFS